MSRRNDQIKIHTESGVDLYWLPLGAGGWFVKFNGRLFEALEARQEHRAALDLYHSALVVRVPEGQFVIEQCWPVPDLDGASRGVVIEGPVGSRYMERFRLFRYEIRRWLDGVISDVDESVESPLHLSNDPAQARRLLDLVSSIPALVWGRDEPGTGEMWNSNSAISWLLATSGIPVENIRPPASGRAPGWKSGLIVAKQGCRDPQSLVA